MPEDPRGPRLDSWKEIAAHLGRDVRTVQRWERGEGLPVHRQQHDKLGSVFAFRNEVDAWRDARSIRPEDPAPGAVTGDESSPAASSPTDTAADIAPVATPPGARRFLRVTLVALAVAVAIGGWVAVGRLVVPVETPRPPISSVVVLPLENLSADPAQEFFAAGLTEEITARLAQLGQLRVVSRTSAISLRNRELSAPAIARELDVDAVVEGSVRREAGQVRISIQLIQAPTDRQLWAHDFEGPADATWPLQIDVARAVADEIRVQATPQERARLAEMRPVNAAAHEEYMLGRYLLWKFIDDDRVRAIEHFKQAIALQPDYAAPYAALAHAWWMRGAFGALSLRDAATPAREAALAALDRDGGNVEALAALAYVQGMFDWEWDRAEATIRRAVRLEPNNVDARYVHSVLLMALGRLDAAVAEIDAAARLDPLSAQVHSTYGRVLYRARRFDEARVHLERAIELEPRNVSSYARLAAVLEHEAQYDAALALVDRAADSSGLPPLSFSGIRARILARAGRTADARRLLAHIPSDAPQRAEVLAELSDRDSAFAALFHALDERESWLPFVKSDPTFEGLHPDPRWAEVLRRMNLQ